MKLIVMFDLPMPKHPLKVAIIGIIARMISFMDKKHGCVLKHLFKRSEARHRDRNRR